MGEILLILIVALLIYGGRLPDVARAIGKSFAELKRGLTETKDVVTRWIDPGIDVRLDDAEPQRQVTRLPPASPELAKEDISAAGDAPPTDATSNRPS